MRAWDIITRICPSARHLSHGRAINIATVLFIIFFPIRSRRIQASGFPSDWGVDSLPLPLARLVAT